MTEKQKMGATELGSLWMTYHKKTMILRMLEYFIAKADDEEAKELMSDLWELLHPKAIELTTMFENDGIALPEGFTKKDVNLEADALWKNGFDIMFSRILKEISMAIYVTHLTVSYRQDVIKFYKDLSTITENYYGFFTQYLIEKRFLSHPNYVNMPKSSDYITDKNYAKGTDILGHKRDINTVEFIYLYHSFSSNITGMQLMDGFAQTAEDTDIKKYFTTGRELSKEQISEVSKILLENNIQPPATPGGTVTNSTAAPFSEKLMMYCNYLLTGLSVGIGGFGAGFSLRNDIQAKNTVIAKDIFEHQRKGTELMMSKGWLEEPPKMDL